MLLRIDDTDPARNVPGGEEAILDDLALARDRVGRGAGAPERPRSSATGRRPPGCPQRFEGVTLLRDGRHRDLPPRERRRRHRLRDHARDPRQRPPAERGAAPRARGRRSAAQPPEFIHYGLMLGPDGKKISKRAEGGSIASLREEGIPAEAVRAYLDELGAPEARRPPRPRADPLARGRRARRALPDEELAARVGVPVGGRAGAARRRTT